MQVQSNSYQLKSFDTDILSKIYSNEFPISFVESTGTHIIFASNNELYSISAGKVKKISTFESTISSLSIHEDMICAGSTSGEVKIIGNYRNALRQYNEHEAAVNDVKIIMDNIVVSCSDDHTIKLYKLSEEKSYKSIRQNDGYIKSLDFKDGMLYVGSKFLREYSLDTFQSRILFENDDVISKICALDLPNIVFASKNKLNKFNTQRNIIELQVPHPKNITNLINYKGNLYSSSVDGHFRTLDYSLQTINDFNLNEKISYFTISRNKPIIALESGVIMSIPEVKEAKKRAQVLPKKHAYEENTDFEIIKSNKKRLTEIENMLRKFEYKESLKLILDLSDKQLAYTVLQYLQEKRGLKKALVDEKEDFVEKVLLLCIEYFPIKEFNGIIIECLVILSSVYSNMIVGSETLKELIVTLSESINEEILFQETLIKSISFLDCFRNKLL